MSDDKSNYAEWVGKLVKECLPLDLQVKLLKLKPLTKAEAQKFINVIQLAAQAKELGEHREMLKKLEEIRCAVASLNTKANRTTSTLEQILWHASGNDPRYKPKDGRAVSSVKEMILREGMTMLAKDATLSERSVADILVRKYADIPGAYNDVETLRKQLNRKNNPPK